MAERKYKSPNPVFIYFAHNLNCGGTIRIGIKKSSSGRIEDHKNYGLKILAVLRGTKGHEDWLHDHFDEHLVPVHKSESDFSYDVVLPCVNRLIEKYPVFKYVDDESCNLLPNIPWSEWSDVILNENKNAPLNGVFFKRHTPPCLPSDEYRTPLHVIELMRRAVGGPISPWYFDFDPASSSVGNEQVKAEYYYTEKTNGLKHSWWSDKKPSTVFLNPPYGEPLAEYFMEKLLDEIDNGHVAQAVTILNAQSMHTEWWPRLVGDLADKHALWAGRINFIGATIKNSTKKKRTSATNGTVISYFGNNPERFSEVMRTQVGRKKGDPGAACIFTSDYFKQSLFRSRT